MSNYKIKDIVVIVISAIIFVGALVFIFEGGGSKEDKSNASGDELIDQPEFISEYNEDVYKKIADFIDYSVLDPTGVCKGDLFSPEDPLSSDSICYALQELGLLSETKETNNSEANSTEENSRNEERKQIVEKAKAAVESYKQKNNDYPAGASNYQLSELLKEGGVLSSFLTSDSKTEDPSKENTRMCYARRSATQYWLYYIAEPTDAPSDCKAEDPKDIKGAIDFSVR
jgi:hypothetical protein